MSIATEVMRVKYTGDGSTTSFTFPFKINAADELIVLIYDSTDKTITQATNFVLTPNSAYPSLGGTITYPSSGTAADGTKIVIIERSMKILQNDSYQYGDTLNLDNIENSLDLMVMHQQQNADKANRSIKLPENVDISDMDLRIPTPQASYGFCWDTTAKKFVAIDFSKIVAGTGIGDMLKSVYDADDDGIVDKAKVAESCSGNAATATKLQTARTIGGVSFDGSANIDLPGVNKEGTQDTTGTAAKATNDVDGNPIKTTYEKSLGNPTLDGQVLSSTVEGIRSWITNSSSPHGKQIFTASGTFTVPAGVTILYLSGCAGGGGAGNGMGSAKGYGGGGGAGQACIKQAVSVTAGNSYTVTIGAGGAGATTGNSNNNGNSGGNTTFGSLLTLAGGGGGYGIDQGGAGGSSVGSLAQQGSYSLNTTDAIVPILMGANIWGVSAPPSSNGVAFGSGAGPSNTTATAYSGAAGFLIIEW